VLQDSAACDSTLAAGQPVALGREALDDNLDFIAIHRQCSIEKMTSWRDFAASLGGLRRVFRS
jgi:hypothetical protein